MLWVGIPPTAIARKQVILPSENWKVHGNLSIRHHCFALHKKSLFCSQVRGEVAYMFIQAKRKLKPIYTSPQGPRKFDGTALTTNESWQF
jgi:hypothetical protein